MISKVMAMKSQLDKVNEDEFKKLTGKEVNARGKEYYGQMMDRIKEMLQTARVQKESIN